MMDRHRGHGRLCPVVNKRPELGCACTPFNPAGYCHVTGNPCGTDTWMVGFHCPCPECIKLPTMPDKGEGAR